ATPIVRHPASPQISFLTADFSRAHASTVGPTNDRGRDGRGQQRELPSRISSAVIRCLIPALLARSPLVPGVLEKVHFDFRVTLRYQQGRNRAVEALSACKLRVASSIQGAGVQRWCSMRRAG